ncbi:MAG: D-arabinono-1,4-lactone oxidase [Mycobacteriales bacterium]
MAEWSNWAGNQRAQPARVVRPADLDEVSKAVTGAAEDGLRVRAVGSGHSFTAAALTDGVLLRMDQLTRLRSADTSTGLVTVEAGMTLHRLCRHLADLGLALTNMGDIDVQTVSGAISTGTHGTGRASASIADQLHGMELVLADGSVTHCSPDRNPELFEAAKVSLGALGVVTAVTFQTEPAYLLHAVEEPVAVDEVLATFDELADGNEHFEFYWFPHSTVALTKCNNRTDGPARPVNRVKDWVDDMLVANHVFGAACRLGRRFPRVTPRINRLSGTLLSRRDYVDRSDRVYTSPRRVRFTEMEYAVPRGAVVEVVRELRDLIDRNGWRISFPIEVRVAPPDPAWLSTAHDRHTAYVAIHRFVGTGLDEYFELAEEIFVAAGGRPHWGKLHTRDAGYLAERYPRFGDFAALRDELDPDRRFTNTYLDRVLGS